ncbi:MBL fold metallo-hydrolase [Maribellus maritimus]|uniref:MBL fold metallo-hydrolase n=1 Tax=Maribellus maritimus TaxID=2870838 RepID=UPI001EEB7A20|nr:MBL fold metallo-hydrolase [Maribellus maritimus]MCG6189684.1 MBL fold metallo-hydrolase [Maribellus maritimus]
MTSPLIFQKRIGYSNSTLILNGENSVLVDTGVKGNLSAFKVWFRQHNLKFSDIKLIILTHTHYDHTGNLIELKKLTGAKVLVHKNEFEHLKNGDTPIPKGQGKYPRFISALGRKFMPAFASPKPFVADWVNENEFKLNTFGIEGKVFTTPGHSAGSQSVLVDDILISGDTFVNMRNGQIFPPFADEPQILLETWQQLFDMEIKLIYPGHGKKFKIEKAFPDFEKWSKKLKYKTT